MAIFEGKLPYHIIHNIKFLLTEFGRATKQTIWFTRRSQGKGKTRRDKSVFVWIAKHLIYKKISQGETYLLTQFLSSPIHRDKSSHDFVKMVKYICVCPNCRKTEQQHNFLFLPFTRDKKAKILSPFPSHDQYFYNLPKFTSTDPLQYMWCYCITCYMSDLYHLYRN